MPMGGPAPCGSFPSARACPQHGRMATKPARAGCHLGMVARGWVSPGTGTGVRCRAKGTCSALWKGALCLGKPPLPSRASRSNTCFCSAVRTHPARPLQRHRNLMNLSLKVTHFNFPFSAFKNELCVCVVPML